MSSTYKAKIGEHLTVEDLTLDALVALVRALAAHPNGTGPVAATSKEAIARQDHLTEAVAKAAARLGTVPRGRARYLAGLDALIAAGDAGMSAEELARSMGAKKGESPKGTNVAFGATLNKAARDCRPRIERMYAIRPQKLYDKHTQEHLTKWRVQDMGDAQRIRAALAELVREEAGG